MENVDFKQAALEYILKVPVIPVMAKKNEPLQGIVGSTDPVMVEKWWRFNMNIGMPTGKGSGIFVVSFASKEAYEEAQSKGIPLTPVSTDGKSFYVFFNYKDGIEDLLNEDVIEKTNVTYNKKYVLLPPSVVEMPAMHGRSELYSWFEERSITDVPLADIPSWMLKGNEDTIELDVHEPDTVEIKSFDDNIKDDEDQTDIATVTEKIISEDEEPVNIHPFTDNNHSLPIDRSWNVPRLFDQHYAEEIKADLLPSWLGDYAKAISESKQTPEGLAVMLGLSMVATCVQKKFVVAPHGDDEYIEPLALWTVTVLKSGERKSQVLKALREPLISWQKGQAELLKDRIFETSTAISIAQGRIEKLHKDAVKLDDTAERQNILSQINEIKRTMPVEVKAPVLWTGDITAEELQDMLVEHGERMAVLAAEGNIFEVMGGLYSDKVNIDIFLQAYSGESTRINRRSRKAELDNPALTFGMAVQPAVIEAFAKGPKAQFRGKGALARFLYCIPEPMVGQRDTDLDIKVPEEIKVKYEDGVKGLLSIPMVVDGSGRELSRMLTLDDEAFKVYKDFLRKNEKRMAVGGELEPINDWGAKLSGSSLRIAGLMHLVEHGAGSTVIGKDTMAKAVHLCELLVEHAKAAFAMAGAYVSSANGKASDAKKMFHWMQENGFTDFDRTNCYKKFKPIKKEQLELALSELEGRHLIREQRISTAGANAINYICNPALV
jgi:hypothetical protein